MLRLIVVSIVKPMLGLSTNGAQFFCVFSRLSALLLFVVSLVSGCHSDPSGTCIFSHMAGEIEVYPEEVPATGNLESEVTVWVYLVGEGCRKPLEGAAVEVFSSRNSRDERIDIIYPPESTTDQEGMAIAYLGSSCPGEAAVSATAERASLCERWEDEQCHLMVKTILFIPACRSGMEACGCVCVDLDVDPENCGQCGNVCDTASEVCDSGECVVMDVDGDGFVREDLGGDDCNDLDSSVHPGAEEVCDGVDNDCDRMSDELPEASESCDDGNECTEDTCIRGSCVNSHDNGIPCDDTSDCTVNDTCRNGVCVGEPRDGDCDGYGTDLCGGDDCDDGNRDVNPAAEEDSLIRFVCSDGIDNDCDGLTDHEEPDCCIPDCAGAECGDGGCPDQPVACGACLGGYWCDDGSCAALGDEPIWVFIPGGTFMMGSDDGYADEQPVHQVSVPEFYMTMTEVTVQQYERCVQEGGCEDFNNCWEYCNWRGLPGRENHPINCISWYLASDFCTWAGGRLPSESEWEYAARGGGRDITFPWGDQRPTCDLAVHNPGCHAGACCPTDCRDGDGDGYGTGTSCLGPDCNDSDPSCQEGECCLGCIDVDGDGYGIGQDCLGTDCNDTDPRRWESGCGPWIDYDMDKRGRGTIWQGPDCNDSDPGCHQGDCCLDCIDIDGDGYGIGDCCLGPDCIEGDDFHDYSGCWQDSTWPVCSKPAGNTDHGLCDMAGNVTEWVQDWYHDDYIGAPTDGSAWEEPVIFYRVIRGCSLYCHSAYLRLQCRSRDVPDTALCDAIDSKGFRCARDVP